MTCIVQQREVTAPLAAARRHMYAQQGTQQNVARLATITHLVCKAQGVRLRSCKVTFFFFLEHVNIRKWNADFNGRYSSPLSGIQNPGFIFINGSPLSGIQNPGFIFINGSPLSGIQNPGFDAAQWTILHQTTE